jgi:hypothetical protein
MPLAETYRVSVPANELADGPNKKKEDLKL